MDVQDFIGLVLYYGRVRFYHSMQKAALDGLAKNPSETVFRLFNGIALVLGKHFQEGIRELNPLKNESEFGLCAILALIYAHKRCNIIDKDALETLEQRKEQSAASSNAESQYFAGVFLFLSGKIEKAMQHAEIAVKLDENHYGAMLLKGWCKLSQKTALGTSVLQCFEQPLAHNNKIIDATLGQVRYYQMTSQFDNAINALNKLSVRFPTLNIPLIEKMETHLAAYDWEQAFETAMQIINLEPTNLSALRMKALLLLIRENKCGASSITLQQLLTATERIERGNHTLLLQICQLFSRSCSRNREMLSILTLFVEKLVKLNPRNVQLITELGYQRLMIGDIKEAANCYRTALKIDDSYFLALCGLTVCEERDKGRTDQVYQQIEFLEDFCGSNRQALVYFLKAKIAERNDQVLPLLVEASEIHLKNLESLMFGVEYIRVLNPSFVLEIAAEMLRISNISITRRKSKIYRTKGSLRIALKHCINLLDLVLRSCPNHIEGTFLRAKVESICGDSSEAAAMLERILSDMDASFMDAYLLLAQIRIEQNEFSKALQFLEVALSNNFEIRDNPMYHLLLGITQKRQNQLPEAKKSLATAMQLAGESFEVRSSTTKKGQSNNVFNVDDKVTLYIELINVLKEMDDPYESERLLQCAMQEFEKTIEGGRLVIAQAELLLQNFQVSQAINLLEAIQPSHAYYTQAKSLLANIFLEHRKDRIAFAKCFQELVELQPDAENYVLLGEAYMTIQEPDLAIAAFQKALDLNPNDSILAKKLGNAYVKTHQYSKAIKYYQEALKNSTHSSLKLDLAELYFKLKQYQNAVSTLTFDAGQNKNDIDDVNNLLLRTKQLLLLARIYEQWGNLPLSFENLKHARENQQKLLKIVAIDQSASLHEQKQQYTKICFLMAQQLSAMRENEQALACYKECLKITPNDVETLSCLARLYMQMNSMDLCRDTCLQMLQVDSTNEAASVMMADLSFRKMDFDNAAFHFSQLLISQPCYWTALSKFIEVMRRSGTLSEAESFLQRAEQSLVNPAQSPGYNFCKGLFEWHSGNPNGALRNFNQARRDYEWGQRALVSMIEICINPDGELPNVNDLGDSSDVEFNESRTIALRTAERLLKELRFKPGIMNHDALNYKLLRNFLLLASKQKYQIESALQDFTDLASSDLYKNMVGPILGMATALVQLKQTQRAKNQLKRLSRINWNLEEAEYLERSWLLLADIYITSSKMDVAITFVDRVLEYNKSSTKAYEMAGYIAEKAQNYRDAAKYYQNAWKCCGRSKPHVGYKLAYNYLKMKRFADAADICQQVIKLHPDYTIIRKDIMDKCRMNLRP